MKSYLEFGEELYNDIFKKYNLLFIPLEYKVFSLQKNFFAVDFIMEPHGDGININYIIIHKDKAHYTTYDIEAYVRSKISDSDKQRLVLASKNTILAYSIEDLSTLSFYLDKCFANILIGDKLWFEDFKKSQYFKKGQMFSFGYEERKLRNLLNSNNKFICYFMKLLHFVLRCQKR